MQAIPLRAANRTARAVRPALLTRILRDDIHSRRDVRSYVSAADLQFGQPLHETHPHILKPGELTPGITAIEYAERRARLAQAMPAGSVAILAASDIKTRSGTVFYKFHQEPSFFYLTGFNEPEALAIIQKASSGNDHTFHLHVRPKDPPKELWEGSRSGTQAALDVFNADESEDINLVNKSLTDVISSATQVLTDIPKPPQQRSTFSRLVSSSHSARWQRLSEALEDAKPRALRPYINQLRAYKSEAEIANLRAAGKASGRGFTEAMRHSWDTESNLEGFLEYQFKKNGCEASAYVPVVAGGENANQIHYVRNDAKLCGGTMVCADAGGEYGGYVADITRTWPVDGKFTAAQRDMYEMILGVQRQCVSLCRENAMVSLDELHSIAEAELREGLNRLGFDLSGNAMATLFPHGLGHFIGLDIHDTPEYPRTVKLKKGQCITVEPGVYVDHDERWPKHFRGVGMRIEDSVCIQEEYPLVLTPEAVKEVVDIEALRR